MARKNISVPDDLYKRMLEAPGHNWSKTASAAFSRALRGPVEFKVGWGFEVCSLRRLLLRCDTVNTVMARLPELSRDLVLGSLRGKTTCELASKHKITREAVRQKLHKAYQELGSSLFGEAELEMKAS